MLTIHSLQNPRVKQALRLRDRRGRQQQARIIVDGWRETCCALRGSATPLELFVCEPLLTGEQFQQLLAQSSARGVDPTLVTREVFEKLAFGDRGEGVVLVADLPHMSLEQLPFPAEAVVGVLEHVEKPGNLGAVLRTADAAGVSAVVVANGGTDLYNPNAIRASLGAIFHVPVCAAGARETRAWLEQAGARIFAARVDGAVPYSQADYRGRCAIVLGSEAQGLSAVWQDTGIQSVALPMHGTVDSLNVSVTAAVLFYEAMRQRGRENVVRVKSFLPSPGS
ncbi:MAG: TrmH family RNA methyltransferase [Pirellulaceae bacterium]